MLSLKRLPQRNIFEALKEDHNLSLYQNVDARLTVVTVSTYGEF